MPTIFSHAVSAVGIASVFPPGTLPRRARLLGALCSMAPDLDVIGFAFGVRYGDPLGHRGLTHSVPFAALVATVLVVVARDRRLVPHRPWLWLYVFLATASHGVLDACTDGGLGVALLAPLSNARYFAPFTPILVSPIGIEPFLSARGLAVLGSEVVWVWLPFLSVAGAVALFRRGWR